MYDGVTLRGDDTVDRNAADIFAPPFFAPLLKRGNRLTKIRGVNVHAKNIHPISN
jgi:hypothetical protein